MCVYLISYPVHTMRHISGTIQHAINICILQPIFYTSCAIYYSNSTVNIHIIHSIYSYSVSHRSIFLCLTFCIMYILYSILRYSLFYDFYHSWAIFNIYIWLIFIFQNPYSTFQISYSFPKFYILLEVSLQVAFWTFWEFVDNEIHFVRQRKPGTVRNQFCGNLWTISRLQASFRGILWIRNAKSASWKICNKIFDRKYDSSSLCREYP